MCWIVIGSDSAENHRFISTAEQCYIRASVSVPTTDGNDVVPWWDFVQSPAVRAIVTAHFAVNWANYFSISWLPKYLVDVLGLSLQQSALSLLLPYIMPFLGSHVAGFIADRLICRGWQIVTVRKSMQAISDLTQCVMWLFFVVVKTPSLSAVIVVLSIGGFTKPFHMAGYWTNILDISPHYAGPILGISNTVASLPGVFANVLTGLLLDGTGLWQVVFLMPCIIHLVGLTVFTRYARGDPLF